MATSVNAMRLNRYRDRSCGDVCRRTSSRWSMSGRARNLQPGTCRAPSTYRCGTCRAGSASYPGIAKSSPTAAVPIACSPSKRWRCCASADSRPCDSNRASPNGVPRDCPWRRSRHAELKRSEEGRAKSRRVQAESMIRIATNGHAYYAVTPGVEAAWRALLLRIAAEAGLVFDFLSYPLPQPQEELWARSDIGCVFLMCGYPIAMRHFAVAPIAAAIPSALWAQGLAVYRSDLIVKVDSHFQTLADTFGGRLGWTTRHSHSAFNALRYHLLQYRTPERPSLYSQVVGDLGSVRKLFESICDGT